MATSVVTSVDVELATKCESSSDQLKTILQTLTDQATQTKSLINTVRSVLKDIDRQSKELEKLRNKRSRNKTERTVNALPSGITKPVAISDELAKFLGVTPGTLVPRNEVTKGVSSYVKKNELSDPENKQRFILDDRPAAQVLKTLLGNPTDLVTYFNLQRYLKHHYTSVQSDKAPASPVKTEDKSSVVKVKKPSTPAQAEPVVEPVEPKKVKKIIVKKKELTEEA